MKTGRLAALLGLLLCACSNGVAVGVASNGGGSAAPATATPVPGGRPSGPSGPPRYDHWDMSKPIRISVACDGMLSSEPLQYFLLHTGLTTSDPEQTDRAAAVVKVIAVGARWNTTDGLRPTQAYIDALQHPTAAPDGTWPVTPNIVTSYTFRIVRTVRGALPGSTVVGYRNGGVVGQDGIAWSGCETTAERSEHAAPVIGHTYLVLFGPELTTLGLGAKPIQQPMIDDLIQYNPATDVLTDVTGPIKLADATKGLAPG